MTENYGAKVSKVGFDVNDPDIANFVLHSAYSFLKLALQGQEANVAASGKTEVVIPHNLGYAPFFLAFMKRGSETKWFALGADLYTWSDPYTGPFERFEGYSRTNDLVLRFQPATDGTTYTFSYFIFVDKVE